MLPQNNPDRIQITFDDPRLVANAGLLLPATRARHPPGPPFNPFIPRCIMSAQKLGRQHAPNTAQTNNPRGRRTMSTTLEPAGYEPDFEAIEADLRQFEKDTEYLQAHWEEWRDHYPDHYVLVYDEKLVSASTDLKEAIRLAESKGIRPGLAAREFFSTDTADLILGSMANLYQ